MFLPPNRDDKNKPDNPGSNNNNGNNNNGNNNGNRKPPQFQFPRWTWLIFLGILLLWSLLRLPDMMSSVSPGQPIALPYSDFYTQVTSNNVSTVTLQDTSVQGTFKSPI